MKSKYKLLLLLTLQSTTLFASTNKVGNGGDGIFCENVKNNNSKGQLLDFYEDKIDLKTSELDPKKIALKQIEKLKIVAPKLANQYLKRLDNILNEIDFKQEIELTDIKDSYHLFKPIHKDCKLLQLAVRKKIISLNEKRFIFSKILWQKLPPIHQAGLLTHEIVYEHLVKLGEDNSVKARRINRMLFREQINQVDFWNLIKELEIPLYP